MRPLPAVLLDLHEDLATGQLVLKRGRVTKTVDLTNGNPVSTASTPRDETLGHFLVSSGVIDETQHRAAVARAAGTKGKLGEALVALQILTVEQLIDQLGRQARHKLVQALRWPQGAWRFDEVSEAVAGMQLRMVEVVFGGLKETAVEDLGRLARLEGLSFELTERGRRLRHEFKRSYGERATSMIAAAGGVPLSEFERVFDDRVQARLAIDAMMMCDVVTTVTEQVGLGAGPTADGTRPRRGTNNPPAAGAELFDMLFEDIGSVSGVGGEGAAPIALPEGVEAEDSGVVSISELNSDRDQAFAARQAVAAEQQRIQGADHYATLKVNRRAKVSEIEAGFLARRVELSSATPVLTDPRDAVRIEALQASYEKARAVLVDDRQRTAYDQELAGGELVQVPPALDTELGFRVAEELMDRGQWDKARGQVRTVIARAPNEADYHAALGWCEWMSGGEVPAAADAARTHLNTALTINPDHAAAHEYKGRIEARLQADDTEGLFHLERAVDLDPSRLGAVAAIEEHLIARGELRRWERVLKRLLFRLRGRNTRDEAKAWARLARLYFEHLEDPQSGAAAVENARKIAPADTDVAALLQRAEQVHARAAEPTRTGWREALSDPRAGAALVHDATATGHIDAAFLAASAMVALGTADATMAELYEHHRGRTVQLPTSTLTRDQWSLLRHKDDTVELGGLVELVAPAVHAIAPMTLADSELDPSMQLAEGDLPASFARIRERVGILLGVAAAPVYPRVELGTQIHVVASDPPVLVAGDEALVAPERPELVFRIARAMTFLWPGRAVGASRPGRVLRAVVMAVFREASGSVVGADDPLADAAAAAVAGLPDAARVKARAAAMRMLSRGGGLNLSLWARSLSRTADRVGLLLAGDVPAAYSAAAEIGDLDRDLQEFTFSAAHVTLRSQLGLARRA